MGTAKHCQFAMDLIEAGKPPVIARALARANYGPSGDATRGMHESFWRYAVAPAMVPIDAKHLPPGGIVFTHEQPTPLRQRLREWAGSMFA
jgi:hypothetical protein